MTSGVVAKDAELLMKFAGLRVPHGIVRAERIRKGQHGQSTLTFEYVMNSGFARFKDGHGDYSSPVESFPQLATRSDNARRVPESRQFPGPHRYTWCRAHICLLCARVGRALWLQDERRWRPKGGRWRSRHRLD